jgi:hypothetical protein
MKKRENQKEMKQWMNGTKLRSNQIKWPFNFSLNLMNRVVSKINRMLVCPYIHIFWIVGNYNQFFLYTLLFSAW